MKNSQRPKLQDVAKEAGVSVTTVSLVLSGKGRISNDVRDQVQAAINKLGYKKPVPKVVNNVDKKQNVGILLRFSEGIKHVLPFLSSTVNSLEENLLKKGYNTVIIAVNYNMSPEYIQNKILRSGVMAIVSINFGNDALFRNLQSLEIPVIVLNNPNYQDRFNCVCGDDYQGGYDGTKYLINKGHRHLGFVRYKEEHHFFLSRYHGYVKALFDSDIAHSDEQVVSIYEDYSNMAVELDRIFAQKPRRTALFVHDDHLAALVIHQLKQMDLKVPQDVSIIAPGDLLDYKVSYMPQITTMHNNTDLTGIIATDLLIRRIENPDKDREVLKIQQTLIERGTCQAIG